MNFAHECKCIECRFCNTERQIEMQSDSTLSPPKIFKRRSPLKQETKILIVPNLSEVHNKFTTSVGPDLDEWSRSFIQIHRDPASKLNECQV